MINVTLSRKICMLKPPTQITILLNSDWRYTCFFDLQWSCYNTLGSYWSVSVSPCQGIYKSSVTMLVTLCLWCHLDNTLYSVAPLPSPVSLCLFCWGKLRALLRNSWQNVNLDYVHMGIYSNKFCLALWHFKWDLIFDLNPIEGASIELLLLKVCRPTCWIKSGVCWTWTDELIMTTFFGTCR